jgi:predicted Zn-dependent protease with MMP-like domain
MILFFYRLYGLCIASELVCPGLPQEVSTEKCDVVIRYGKVNPADPKDGFHVETPQNITFHVNGVGSYRIAGGNSIVVEKELQAGDSLIRLFLLGSAMGALFHQRAMLPLHGNGIAHDGGCIAVLGHSGKGKSTLAAAFRNRGYKLLSDDICALKFRPDGAPIAYPGIPRINLWHDAIQKVGADKGRMEQIHPDEEKFSLSVDAEYCDAPMPLKRVYILEVHDEHKIVIEPLPPLKKIQLLRIHTYRKWILTRMGATKQHFKMCADVAQQVQISRIHRPAHAFLLDELVERIEEDMKENLK